MADMQETTMQTVQPPQTALASATYRVAYSYPGSVFEQTERDVHAYSPEDATARVTQSMALYEVTILRVVMLNAPEPVVCTYNEDHGCGPGWTFDAHDECGHRIEGAVLVCDVHGRPAHGEAYMLAPDEDYTGPCAWHPDPLGGVGSLTSEEC